MKFRISRIVLTSPLAFSVYATDFFAFQSLRILFLVRTRFHPEHVSYLSFFVYLSIRKKKYLKCRSWIGSCRSSTRYDLNRDMFIAIWCVVFRARILIIEFSQWCPSFFMLYLLISRVLILHLKIAYGARLQDTLNMRQSRDSSSLLCQKECACSHVSDLSAVVTFICYRRTVEAHHHHQQMHVFIRWRRWYQEIYRATLHYVIVQIYTTLVKEQKRNLIIDFFRQIVDEVMGWNLIWRTLRRFVFSFMCSDVAREVREYDRNGHNSIFFNYAERSHSSKLKILLFRFFRRHTKYRITTSPLITKLVSDYLLKIMSITTLILVKMSWSAISTDIRRRRSCLGHSTYSYLTYNEVRSNRTTEDKDNNNDTVRQYISGVFEEVEHEYIQTILDKLKESETDKHHENRYDESNSCSSVK